MRTHLTHFTRNLLKRRGLRRRCSISLKEEALKKGRRKPLSKQVGGKFCPLSGRVKGKRNVEMNFQTVNYAFHSGFPVFPSRAFSSPPRGRYLNYLQFRGRKAHTKNRAATSWKWLQKVPGTKKGSSFNRAF